MDCITGDKGWSIEYTVTLTFRQIGVLWERYWDRKMWELRQQAKLSGLGALGGSSSGTTGHSELMDGSSDSAKNIDATTDEGIMEMQARGLPIKFVSSQDLE